MKKILALILATLMLVALVACGTPAETTGGEDENTNTPTGNVTDAPETDAPETDAPVAGDAVAENALEIINTVWESITDAEKEELYFSVSGGYGDNMSWDAPGALPTDVEDARLTAMSIFVLSEELLAMVDGEIGMAMNPMASRNFTAGCFHIADSANVEAFAAALKDAVLNNQWACGFPEKYTLIVIGDYVLSMYGAASQIDAFTAKTQAAYENATVVAVENIA